MIMQNLKKAIALFLVSVLGAPGGAVAAEVRNIKKQAAPVVASFSGAEVADDAVTIKLSTSVPYNSFLTQHPPRLVVDLLDTKDAAVQRSVKGRGHYLKAVRSSQFQRRPRLITRVVFDLVEAAVYKIGTDPTGMVVNFAASESAPSDVELVSTPKTPKKGVAAPTSTAASTHVSEAEKSERTVTKDLSAAAAFKRAGLEGKMRSDLVAAVQSEDVTMNEVTIPSDIGDEGAGKHALGGRIYRDAFSRLPTDLVTLDFDNTDVRDVIKLLAAKSKINIIYGPDVSGTLTLHLADVPFNEAFRTVLSMMQMTTDQVGNNILRVITPAALATQRTASSAITKVIPLNYAKAAMVKNTIDAVRSAEGRAGNSSTDLNTNSIIVTESLEGMLATENLINQLDQRPRQVLIEAKLIEVSLNNAINYGIQWNYANVQNGTIGGQKGLNTIGTPIGSSVSPSLNPLNAAGGVTTPGITGGGGVGAAGPGTGVSLAADKIFGALTFGRVTNNYLVNATIAAAASEGKAKVLSDPKIATLNNQAANINVTTQIPYVTSNVASTGVQTQSVSYVTTGIQMSVTPSINADGRILLVVNPSVSQPSVSAAANTLTGAPAVDTRNAQTSVLVRDGETIVIGGLISDSLQDTIAKVPLLGDIPLIGWLFKKKTKSRVRNELLIFVTTHILPD